MRKEKATLFLLAFVPTVAADGYGNYGGGDDADDFYQQQDDVNNYADEVQYYDDDSFIQYWTEYAIEPRRCINYQGADVIVFSMYEQKHQMCSDKPIGTYVTPVPTFIDAWLAQQAQQAQDNGNDYEAPDAASYVQCTVTEVENQVMYLQVGCSDVTSKSIAINIYSDATCETPSKVDGYDDANVDITEIQPPFKSCLPCVVWYDTDDQGVDDQFYEKRQTNPPLCKNVWDYRSDCNKKCQKIGVEKESEGSVWNTSDKVLLVILSLFAVGMFIKIFTKRRSMSNKNLLIEQAALSAIGLQETHVYGMIALWILVTVIFVCLGLKGATWAMLLIVNIALFAYLMKLTVASGATGKREPIIGPDGQEIDDDDSDEDSQDDDDDDDEEDNPRPVGELI